MLRFFIALLLFHQAVKGERFRLSIRNGNRQVVEIKSFGFYGNEDDTQATRSNFTIIVRKFQVYGPGTLESKGRRVKMKKVKGPVGFSLERRETINTARMEQNVRYENGSCFADWKRPERVMLLYPQTETGWQPKAHSHLVHYNPNDGRKRMSYDFSPWVVEGFMSLFFFTCEKDITFDFEIEVIEYNFQENGKISYLPAGKEKLPTLYLGFFLAYVAALCIFIRTLKQEWSHVHKIHILMCFVIGIKGISLFFEALQWHVLKEKGQHSLGVDIPTYFFLGLKAMMLMSVLILIGTGWSVLKPMLGEKDRQIILVVLPLQVMVNVATVVVETLNEGNKQWSVWRDMLKLLDIVCCCAILLPVVWSIRNLKETQDRAGDSKAAKNLARMRQFQGFYVVVILYIYFTRIIYVLVLSALHWQMTWFGPFILEAGSLLFYLFVGYRFQPKGEQSFLAQLREEEKDEPGENEPPSSV